MYENDELYWQLWYNKYEKAIEESGFLITYVMYSNSNTMKFIEYAKKCNVNIIKQISI